MRAVSIALVVSGLLTLTGCDWTSSGSEGSWSSSYDAVNFSGVYRGQNGAAVAVGVSSTPGGTIPVGNELAGTADGQMTAYAGVLKNKPIDPGSLTMATPGYTFSDNGANVLEGSGGTSGTINYGTGAWTLNFGPNAPSQGAPIHASYSYTTEGSGEQTVKTLNVTQTGQKLRIEASNGVVFEGQFGGLGTSGSLGGYDLMVAEFSANANHGGQRIRLVGTFEGVLYTDTGEGTGGGGDLQGVLGDRLINATWIEDGTGQALDVFGVAPNVAVSISTMPTTP